ncbi:hypothetical protein AB0M22_16980 [Nocardia sp. NPDC051756]|uniref:hypothetical protein n=1 Tax=Nocardia sp. NPDC051756 TaxID=3154751 RepID=UPI0034388C5C
MLGLRSFAVAVSTPLIALLMTSGGAAAADDGKEWRVCNSSSFTLSSSTESVALVEQARLRVRAAACRLSTFVRPGDNAFYVIAKQRLQEAKDAESDIAALNKVAVDTTKDAVGAIKLLAEGGSEENRADRLKTADVYEKAAKAAQAAVEAPEDVDLANAAAKAENAARWASVDSIGEDVPLIKK